MVYELYLDVFFLVNFLMDYLVLQIIRKILSRNVPGRNILVGAAAGAAGCCLAVCLPFSALSRFVLFHMVINLLMIKIALDIHGVIQLAQGAALLYLVSFLFGGFLTWLSQYTGENLRMGLVFASAVIAAYAGISGLLLWVKRKMRIGQFFCRVTVWSGGRSIQLPAVIDSGNGLFDSYTGKPVHIIGNKAIKKLTGGKLPEKIRYIPYHTVGEGANVMPLFQADRICIHGEEERTVEHPLVAVSDRETFAGGRYEMILHPEGCQTARR